MATRDRGTIKLHKSVAKSAGSDEVVTKLRAKKPSKVASEEAAITGLRKSKAGD